MSQLKKIVLAVAAMAALALGGSAIAGATSGPDPAPRGEESSEPRESPAEEAKEDAGERVSGTAADRAEAAALKVTGGRANSVERDSENGATWEVEVTRRDGVTVDVRLDESYEVVVIEEDREE